MNVIYSASTTKNRNLVNATCRIPWHIKEQYIGPPLKLQNLINIKLWNVLNKRHQRVVTFVTKEICYFVFELNTIELNELTLKIKLKKSQQKLN